MAAVPESDFRGGADITNHPSFQTGRTDGQGKSTSEAAYGSRWGAGNADDFATGLLGTHKVFRGTAGIKPTLTVQGLQALGTDDGIAVDDKVFVSSGNLYRCVTVTASTSTWRPCNNLHNIEDYGASPTSGFAATNDAAIEAAQASAAALGGGTCYAREGGWPISAKIGLRTGVSWLGDGGGQTVFVPISGGLAGPVFGKASGVVNGLTIRSIRVNNTSRAVSGGIGIDLTDCNHVKVYDVSIANCETGLKIADSGYYNRIVGTEIGPCVVGVQITNNANDNTLMGVKLSGFSQAGFLFDDESGSGQTNNLLMSCSAEALETGAIGFHIHAANGGALSRITIINPRIESSVGPTGTALKLQVTSGTIDGVIWMNPVVASITTNIDYGGQEDQLHVWDASSNHLSLGNFKMNHASGVVHFRNVADSLYRSIQILSATVTGNITCTGSSGSQFSAPLGPGSYTVAGLPAASSHTGRMVYVSNETGGATIAFSDGTNWRRSTDRAIVS